MTVNSTKITAGPYIGNDIADTFSYTFRIEDKSQITVFETDADGVQTELTVDTHFTVAGIGNDAGGTVTRTTGPLPIGNEWYIRSNYKETQLVDLESQGGFFPDVHEFVMDKLTFLIQQLLDKVGRALRFSDGYSGNASTILPAPQAGHVYVWDNTGESLTSVPLNAEGTYLDFVKTEIEYVADQLVYPMDPPLASENVIVANGFVLKATGDDKQYSIDSNGDLVLTSPLTANFEVWNRPVAGTPEQFPIGSRGNPYEFDTLADFTATASVIPVGSWVDVLGKDSVYDELNAQYQMVELDDVGEGSSTIIVFADRKALMMYAAPGYFPSNGSGGDTTMSNYPYSFSFPVTDLDRQEMLNNITVDAAGFRSIGDGGSTWWSRPTTVGRKENGIDVFYRGDVSGSPENRDRVQEPNEDDTLHTNKRLGEAIIKLTRVEYDGTNYEYSAEAINDKLISYREDEHQQPSVLLNNVNGQVITSWGSRNSARSQDGEDVTNINYFRYGQDSRVLSVSEAVEFDTNADYASMFFVGRTCFSFSREGVGNWHFTRGTGGQNYLDPTQFFDAGGSELENQFYFCISGVDKSQVLSDPQDSGDRNIVHFFGAPHPTSNPDNKLYYCKGTFIPANQESSPFDGGGLYVTKVDGTTPVSGTNGRLDGNFVAFDKTAMDEAYTPSAGRSYRLLDVYYGDDPMALIAEFTFDWTHGASIPYQKTWDLKIIRWNGASWTSTTVETGLRGCLGYDPMQNGFNSSGGSTGSVGVEGFTSFYALGASFWRGSDYTDTTASIFYCDRDGDARDKYRLNRQDYTDNTFTTKSGGVSRIVENSREIIYRPEMTLGGDRRTLFANFANGWSSFNSYVADTKFIDLTP